MARFPSEYLQGARLLLRPPVLDDAEALFDGIAHDPEVTRYLLWTPHPDVGETRRVITEHFNVGDDERTWLLVTRDSGDVAGLISCRSRVRHSIEVGYCLGRRWWNGGFMSEALGMLLAELAADPGVYRVWATCHIDNMRSARLLQRAGFAFEGRLRRHSIYPSLGPEPHDSLLYAKILR